MKEEPLDQFFSKRETILGLFSDIKKTIVTSTWAKSNQRGHPKESENGFFNKRLQKTKKC